MRSDHPETVEGRIVRLEVNGATGGGAMGRVECLTLNFIIIADGQDTHQICQRINKALRSLRLDVE